MTTTRSSRRRFMTSLGVAAGGLLGETAAQGQTGAQNGRDAQKSGASKGERFRRAVEDPQGLVLPVVNSVLMARLCELEGFRAGFVGGSGVAAMYGLPNYGLGTVTEVMSYMTQIVENTDLPIMVDAEDGGGSPTIVYRVVQEFERAGAASLMIEDAVDARSHFNGEGAPVASAAEMANRVKAAVDARRDGSLMIMVRCNAPAKGYSEEHALDLAAACVSAGADAFYFAGFTLAQQLKAKQLFKKPLMIGSSAPASEWKSQGVDMAYYHVERVGLGAIHLALKELKATGRFVEAAKMELSNDLNSRITDQAQWRERAKKYGLIQ